MFKKSSLLRQCSVSQNSNTRYVGSSKSRLDFKGLAKFGMELLCRNGGSPLDVVYH